MKKRKLGRTDLYVSELNLNTDTFGWFADQAESFALLDSYYSCGGNFIQTVAAAPDAVTFGLSDSASEHIVGRWLETRGISRGGLVVASRLDLLRPSYGDSRAFADLMRESCESSLRRLGTTHLDLLICEWDENLRPLDEVLGAADQLIRAGMVRHVAAAGSSCQPVVESLRGSPFRGHPRFEALQADYSLMDRTCFPPETIARCREHRLGFLAHSPLAGGFLTRRPRRRGFDDDWRDERFGNEAGDAVLRVLAEVADKRLATPAQIALAWVLRHPQITSAAITPSSPRELRELVRAASTILTPEEMTAFPSVSPWHASPAHLQHV